MVCPGVHLVELRVSFKTFSGFINRLIFKSPGNSNRIPFLKKGTDKMPCTIGAVLKKIIEY